MSNSAYLASKPRYEILDGLRGVAALTVVAFHLFEAYSSGPMHQFINHGYLAVDFFFVLSGFVVGYAYDDRWGRMSLKDFFKRRLVRLHPMVIMGTLIGAIFFYFTDGSAFGNVGTFPWWMTLVVMLLGLVMIPVTPALDIRGWGEMNPLNGPNWSLTWEYFANLLYALVIRHFSKIALGIFVLCSAVLTVDLTMNIDLFHLFSANRTGAAYTVIGGWSLTPDQLYIGLTRLLYPFFMGLLLARMNRLVKVKRGFWWCSLLVLIVLFMPRIGGTEQPWLNGAYEAFCILLVFPFIVTLGAGSTITGKRSVAVCKFLGEISYPLYITHYPLIYLQTTYAGNHADAPLGNHIFVGVSIFVLSIGIAYACLRLYDLPVREWLKEHWLMKKKQNDISAKL